MNVLVVDDDSVTRLLLSSALTKLGYHVVAAEDAHEALRIWEEQKQHLIISDWMMPDIDGLELCRRIRAKNGAGFTYIILLTARTGKANYIEAMEAGADDFITKPFDRDQLAARLRVTERILGLHEELLKANSHLEQRVFERTEQLEKALQAKSEFLSCASHELRTPMNHVLGFAQLLELDSLTSEQNESVQHILRSGRDLLTLIDRILDVSKSNSLDLSFLETSKTQSAASRQRRSREPR